MSLVPLVGDGLWYPMLVGGYLRSSGVGNSSTMLMDTTDEEVQLIGAVHIDGGGSKTFGTSSLMGWLLGTPITFLVNSTVRVGVKKAASIDTATGPVARATLGAAAFDVYDDLIGGTDTLTANTWRNDAMSAGTPFTVADGDLLALCWHLTTTAGTPIVRVSTGATTSTLGFPVVTLVTAGPTYAAQGALSNTLLTFDDGTLGWLRPTRIFLAGDTASSAIGNGNILGNVFRVPFTCAIDAVAGTLDPSTNAANFALELYSTPLGTPGLVESVSHDANVTSAVASQRFYVRQFTTPRTLAANTDYAIGVKQTTATAVAVLQHSVSAAAHFKPTGMGAECYSALSTAGAVFVQQGSGTLRNHLWMHISALDDGVSAGGGGGLRLVGTGGLVT